MRMKMKRCLGILLSITLMLGMMPRMSLTAYAEPTEVLLTTITATGAEQASYSTANVATVSFSYTEEGSSSYNANWGWWGYGWTATVTAADGYTITKCVFYDDANRTATDSSSPFVVETTEEDKTPMVNGGVINSSSKGIKKIEVYGYAPSSDPEPESSYTITIPATLTVANSGWNATDGISATGTLESGKKLTVSATSANSFALISGENSISYTLATASTDTEATTSWEFDSLSGTATRKAMGIIVDDYSSKPAGTYQDTVTFTAKVENAGISVSSVTINNAPTEALFVNSTGTLTATVLPDEATDKTVTWSSSDPDYVSINETTGAYEIKGTKGYGSATITATAGEKSTTCTITSKVTYTSLKVGDVIHVGDTVYSTSSIFCDYNGTKSTMNFSNGGVYKLIIDDGVYKWQRSNGSNVSIRINNTNSSNGIKVASGSGTSSSNRMTFAAN